jgi:DNA helicase-2/ATP-dependent DNA helicase PcrA
MVIAGPGTGKTELLSMRAANILRQTDTLPENILCLTFTESGADAMRRRLISIIGADAYKIAIHTFHSFGTEIINQNGQFFYNGAKFQTADDLSSYEILRSIFDGLNHKNPLVVMTNGEYPYLGDTAQVISELKRNGFTGDELRLVLDANDKVLDEIEPIIGKIFANRISKATLDALPAVVETARKLTTTSPLATVPSLSILVADSLDEALRSGKTTPVTAWKNAWLKKNAHNEFIFASRERQARLRTVISIYEQYLQKMHESALFDFDDMILRVVHAIELFPELRFNLQERFQYIMVDEFQDTNLAQMRILFGLTDNPVNNGRPNLMVVGDDDQAIYSFQGADVGNIHSFRETYPDAATIVLTDNYRSTAQVLEQARSVISLGSDRLETIVPGLDKTLTPHHPAVDNAVTLTELPFVRSERNHIVSSIRQAIDSGHDPSSIAVLARRHHELVALLPYFAKAGIAVNYERRDNVLDNESIKAIELAASIVVALYEQRHNDANSLLPQLLAHPAFGISAETLWRLSLETQTNRVSWMEQLASTPELALVHEWLITSAQRVATTPLEHMIDQLVGAPDPVNPEQFQSPFFDYFFAADKLTAQPDAYLLHLESLQTIRQLLRDYHPDETPHLQTFLEFIHLHRDLDRPIMTIRRAGDHITQAVNLMSAHKSKGLEFDTVYIIGAVDSMWGERVRSRSRLINYPENLQLAPAGDSANERLRLFFVAMTRAKKHLHISYSLGDSSGKSLTRAGFLLGDQWQATTPPAETTVDDALAAAKLEWYQPVITPLTQALQDLLRPKLETYKLSSTHLTSFLDVTRGGPQGFLIKNLLRFPQAMQPNAAYGSAIHITLQHAHAHLAATGNHKPEEDILSDFETNLRDQHMPDDAFQTFLQKGSETLTVFLQEKYHSFTPTQKVELSFANQGVSIGDAHLTGSLDLVDINNDTITVTDYKTGKPSAGWIGKTDYEKIKLHRYRQQLMFYNLLVANSRDYSKYSFDRGILQFVEPTTEGSILAIDATFTTQELNDFAQLIQAVWRRITTLDFVDTSAFDPSYKGIIAFEQSIIDES